MALVRALHADAADQPKASVMLTCDDLRTTYEVLSAKGVEFTIHPGGGSNFVAFTDPDGNEFLMSDSLSNWMNEAAPKRFEEGEPT